MKLTKGLFSLICAFICASILISIGAVIYKESSPTASVRDIPAEDQENSSAVTETGTQSPMILKEYQGNIGVFSDGGELLWTVDIAVVTLPIQDRKRLESGIKAKSEEEIYSLIEDYSG